MQLFMMLSASKNCHDISLVTHSVLYWGLERAVILRYGFHEEKSTGAFVATFLSTEFLSVPNPLLYKRAFRYRSRNALLGDMSPHKSD